MKIITAEKVKDGWVVRIIDTRHLHHESEVKKLIKQEGLKVCDEASDSNSIVAL